MLLGSIIFIALGIWMQFDAINPVIEGNVLLKNPVFLRIIGMSSISFFGLCAFVITKKLGDKCPGLIISAEGITDNSSAVSAGLIPWTEILEIKETKVANHLFINIFTKNPQEYIERQSSTFRRKVMQLNYNKYGTVIAISANSLKCNYIELKNLLDKYLEEFKNKNALK